MPLADAITDASVDNFELIMLVVDLTVVDLKFDS